MPLDDDGRPLPLRARHAEPFERDVGDDEILCEDDEEVQPPPPGYGYRTEDESEAAATARAAIAALLAAGYTLGHRAMSFMHDVEAQHGVASKAAELYEEGKALVRQKVAEVDEAHGVSARVRSAVATTNHERRPFSRA